MPYIVIRGGGDLFLYRLKTGLMRILTHCIDKMVGVVKVVYCCEGETFKERVADMKNLVETSELQNALLYDTPSDISSRIASRIAATIDQIG